MIPLQQKHSHPLRCCESGSSQEIHSGFQDVEVPALAFVDLTQRVDLAKLTTGPGEQAGQRNFSPIDLTESGAPSPIDLTQSDTEYQNGTVTGKKAPTALGKRREVDQLHLAPAKKARLDLANADRSEGRLKDICLISTACSFQMVCKSEQPNNFPADALEDGTNFEVWLDALHGNSQIFAKQQEYADDTAPVQLRHINLRQKQIGPLLATLPVFVDATRGMSNGPWLLAALRLRDLGRLDLRSRATLTRRSSAHPNAAPGHGSLILNIAIELFLTEKSYIPSNDCAVANDFLRILRFAKPSTVMRSEVSSREQSRKGKERAREEIELDEEVEEDLSIASIYEALKGTPKTNTLISHQHPDLSAVLLPFQQRSMSFLLNAESDGASVASGSVESQSLSSAQPSFWNEEVCQTAQGPLHLNSMYGHFSFTAQDGTPRKQRSAILADEMGLGKVSTGQILRPKPSC